MAAGRVELATTLQQLKEETLLHTVDPPSNSRGRRAAVFYLVLCTAILQERRVVLGPG